MKTQSCKAKGRKLQQTVIALLQQRLGILDGDIENRSMGCGGEDVILSNVARTLFNYSIECKNTERISIYRAYKQAETNCGGHEPLLVIKKNHHKPLAVVDLEHFIGLHAHD